MQKVKHPAGQAGCLEDYEAGSLRTNRRRLEQERTQQAQTEGLKQSDFLEAEHGHGDPIPEQPHGDAHKEGEDEQCEQHQDGGGEDSSDFIHNFVLFDG